MADEHDIFTPIIQKGKRRKRLIYPMLALNAWAIDQDRRWNISATGAKITAWVVLIIVLLFFLEVLFPGFFCNLFTFMDWNGPGEQDDLPFCWTPFGGIQR